MSIGTILLVVVVLMLVGFSPLWLSPVWQHASGSGSGPSATVGAALLVFVVLFLLMGRL